MESPTNFPPDSWVHMGLLVTIFAPTPVATGERRIEMEVDELSNVSP